MHAVGAGITGQRVSRGGHVPAVPGSWRFGTAMSSKQHPGLNLHDIYLKQREHKHNNQKLQQITLHDICTGLEDEAKTMLIMLLNSDLPNQEIPWPAQPVLAKLRKSTDRVPLLPVRVELTWDSAVNHRALLSQTVQTPI